MADFIQVLFDNLSSLIKGEIGLIFGVEDEMEKLRSTFTTIQAVIEDAEDQQVESKPIRNWLRKLKDLAFKIQDILDECAAEVSMTQHRNRKWGLDSLKKILYRLNIGRRIKELASKLDAVVAEREKFHLREMVVERQQSKFASTPETISILNGPDFIYGRDYERDEIVGILLNQVRDNERLSVLPIVGIGGLGKTTLAQLVYNDARGSEHFETKLWVCVSHNFNLKTLVTAMLECATNRTWIASDSTRLDTLQHQPRESLTQKRYLIILDNVWIEDQEEWAMVINALACGSKGASIVNTTRLKSGGLPLAAKSSFLLYHFESLYTHFLTKNAKMASSSEKNVSSKDGENKTLMYQVKYLQEQAKELKESLELAKEARAAQDREISILKDELVRSQAIIRRAREDSLELGIFNTKEEDLSEDEEDHMEEKLRKMTKYRDEAPELVDEIEVLTKRRIGRMREKVKEYEDTSAFLAFQNDEVKEANKELMKENAKLKDKLKRIDEYILKVRWQMEGLGRTLNQDPIEVEQGAIVPSPTPRGQGRLRGRPRRCVGSDSISRKKRECPSDIETISNDEGDLKGIGSTKRRKGRPQSAGITIRG